MSILLLIWGIALALIEALQLSAKGSFSTLDSDDFFVVFFVGVFVALIVRAREFGINRSFVSSCLGVSLDFLDHCS